MSTYYEDVIFETRSNAEDTLERLKEIAETYGHATKSDLYDLAGLKSSYRDTQKGWTESMLRYNAHVSRVRNGWTISFSVPVQSFYNSEAWAGVKEKTFEPKPVYITINRDVHENVDDVLGALFKRIVTVPGRKFHITIE